MANAKFVDIVNTCKQFLQISAGCAFLQLLVLDNQVEKLSSACELHHKVEIFLCFDNFIDLNNIWVMELFEDFNFATDAFDIFFVFDL